MNWFQNFVIKLLRITPARDKKITIKEPLTFQSNVLKNKILYRGDPVELEQFFKKTASYDVEKTRFWASVPQGKIRKIHSGIVGVVIERYKDIVTSDMGKVTFDEEGEITPTDDRWNKIAESNKFNKSVGEALANCLAAGDGAFKICVDEGMEYPVIEFFSAEDVEFITSHGQLKEIKYYTSYHKSEKEYRLEETYGKGYIRYKLYDDSGKEMALDLIDETAVLFDVNYSGDFIMGVPLKIFDSKKWPGRGSALFDGKTDAVDALDEVISQWVDAIRLGRIKRYIPDNLIPKDPDTGETMQPNPFDNDFISLGEGLSEKEAAKIDVSQPEIAYDAYLNSYMSFMDIVLQGIISPATLGIDLKKTDNAEAQREKEKVTMHVRKKIVEALTNVLPELAKIAMMTYDVMHGGAPKTYEASIEFGEYASPDFDSTVEVVGKAKTYGIMSTEKAIDEMYGDSMTDEEKAIEVARIKVEQGIVEMEEPAVNQNTGDFNLGIDGGTGDEGQGGKTNLSNGQGGIPGAAKSGQ